MNLRLLIADDHEVMRLGVRSLLSHKRGWHVCGEATTGMEAVEKVCELSPDVVILDLSMPGMNGFEAAEKIRRSAPSTKIVIFSVHEIPASARIVGADAFVPKSADADDLISAIELVASPQRNPKSNHSVYRGYLGLTGVTWARRMAQSSP